MSNITCFKHSSYRGDTPPDLSCKVCCSKFVGRIRAEQSAKFEELQKVSRTPSSVYPVQDKPVQMKALQIPSSPNKAKPTFDASWI